MLGGFSPLLQRIYHARGVAASAELDYSLNALIPPDQLGGTQAAAQLLHQVMTEQGRILIVADFDADGATSCALAIRSLHAMGADNVNFMVPNRFNDGYGLTPAIAEKALSFQPDLVITVDNGISSIEGVRFLRDAGVAVLVTDHHLAGSELPDANVIVNPNSPDEPFPSKNLAGVGVVFYVMIALRSYLRGQGWFTKRDITEPNLADYLDLVALGTVADVVKLDHNNRILVKQGLARIRAGRCCELIGWIFKLAGKSLSAARSSDLGFTVGPRLNAAGRLEDMSIGIVALLSDSSDKANETAYLLEDLNSARKTIELEMKQQAVADIDSFQLGEEIPAGLCIYQERWHQGVIGILASRIKERYNRPVIAFADADNETLKGSARSITGVHIKDVLESIAVANPQILEKFGGHAMAAGLTLKRCDFELFSRYFEEEVGLRLNGKLPNGDIITDGSLAQHAPDIELAQQLNEAGPWGQGFPEPLFDDQFEIIQQRTVGGTHAKMMLRSVDTQESFDAIAFNQAERLPDNSRATIHAAYRLDINEYQGVRRLQLLIEYFQVI
ncbi:MAG: single-stranded-DNA-specific exonuclease RecJ [Sedimenticola selenatireducens]|uniref:Single-stranded-DNA-specific exonuclease RecJ n=2 Tax=Sedimenticola selenatireducens TaxID=191960 RepID=A0A558DQ19_9GAMM|nr:single-stranded-DNA-specific exonuclease RecJ [Sedimenticola selenatireducens]TVO70562.1 single-stranded-DNA-specific exonuclease RecJ [Sedimenticola selenatireducens]TVT63139.1 MAG: single-stranded-DNA-specific exonuclease RecJ [Sedimenticola selenatireducens]